MMMRRRRRRRRMMECPLKRRTYEHWSCTSSCVWAVRLFLAAHRQQQTSQMSCLKDQLQNSTWRWYLPSSALFQALLFSILLYCILFYIFYCISDTVILEYKAWLQVTFLPRCMECRRGLAMRIMSVCRLSVCQTRGLWQNGRKICPVFYTIRKNI